GYGPMGERGCPVAPPHGAVPRREALAPASSGAAGEARFGSFPCRRGNAPGISSTGRPGQERRPSLAPRRGCMSFRLSVLWPVLGLAIAVGLSACDDPV